MKSGVNCSPAAMFSLLIFFAATTPILVTEAAATNAPVTNEDIRDAILSLVTIFRDNSDKLERHELRERQLGEQLKKALAGLDKRYRNQDVVISQMAEKIKSLDSIFNMKEEREQYQLKTLGESLTKVEKTLNGMMKEIESGSKGVQATYTLQETPMEASIIARLEQITAHSDESTKLLKDTEKIIKNIEKKLEEGNKSNGKGLVQAESLYQTQTLGALVDTAIEIRNSISNLPGKLEIQELMNGTGETLQEVREELLGSGERGVALLLMKLEEKTKHLSAQQDDIIKTTIETQSMAESFNEGVSTSYEKLLTEVKGLSKVEQVMIQTADNVMDTKRRIEYGVHQILLEVGELVKHQGKSLNGTVNQRFDDIESTILDNQTGALSNLTTKIETEISQVWRQIGIMYQQLTASATALDRLQQQTDAYVNGSVKTMDSMENKVGMITSRMTEVDENLNFLLGRLSLVTSEYNQIKSGLSSALDDMRDSFLQVQGKLKDLGPGPRPIAEEKEEIGNDVPSG